MNYSQSGTPGVQHIPGKQDTDAAAKQALQEQAPGSEFSPPPHPDLERMVARLNELDKECTSICDKMWMSNPGWQEREELQEQLDRLDKERGSLWALLAQIADGMDTSGDKGGPYTGE